MFSIFYNGTNLILRRIFKGSKRFTSSLPMEILLKIFELSFWINKIDLDNLDRMTYQSYTENAELVTEDLITVEDYFILAEITFMDFKAMIPLDYYLGFRTTFIFNNSPFK